MSIEQLPLKYAFDRIEKEVDTFDEIYHQPKINGVVDLFVPNHTKKVLHKRLIYLEDNLGSLPDKNKARNLIVRMKEIGQVLGFDSRGYAEQEDLNENGLDLSKKIPKREGVPFFAWQTGGFSSYDLEENKGIEEDVLIERRLGPIYDSREYNDCGSTLERNILTHGLSFHKKDVQGGSDTRLSFAYQLDGFGDFMYNISFHMKKGKLKEVTCMNYKIDVHTALRNIEKELRVSPKHIKAYINDSNLTDEHRRQIRDVIDVLSTYPKRDIYELFDAQKPVEDASRVDLSQLKPHFEYVTVSGLTSTDLRNTGLPDDNLLFASFNFRSAEKNDYHVSYQAKHLTGPYLCLTSEGHKNRKDFRRVERVLKQHIFGMRSQGDICGGGDNINNIYSLGDRPTQMGIAQAIDGFYKINFQDIIIGDVRFSKVYEGFVNDSPIPRERIRTDEVILL